MQRSDLALLVAELLTRMGLVQLGKELYNRK